MAAEKKQEKFREFEISLFTGESTEELLEHTKKAHLDGFRPVSDVLKVEISRLREDLKDGYLQVFGKLR